MVNEADWKEIGDLSKSIRNDLSKLRSLSQNSGMRREETDHLARTAAHLNKFRNKAENFMFSQGIKDFNIFFGGDSDS